jgi:beta-xylosidase
MYTNSTGTIVHKVGTWAVMMNTNVATYLEMDFDLPYGASKFSFYYGVATQTNANDVTVTSAPIIVKAEYSQDSGATWTQLGEDLTVTTVEDQYFKEYELDINGPVRFRIGKNNSRARLMVDEIAVYEN